MDALYFAHVIIERRRSSRASLEFQVGIKIYLEGVFL